MKKWIKILLVTLGIIAVLAVSYTHLDVYKRQGPVVHPHRHPFINFHILQRTYGDDADILHARICLLYTSRCV